LDKNDKINWIIDNLNNKTVTRKKSNRVPQTVKFWADEESYNTSSGVSGSWFWRDNSTIIIFRNKTGFCLVNADNTIAYFLQEEVI